MTYDTIHLLVIKALIIFMFYLQPETRAKDTLLLRRYREEIETVVFLVIFR